MGEDKDLIVFGPAEERGISNARRRAAEGYVKKALAMASKDAIDFQHSLILDEEADPKIRFAASEAVLDRFMGKAAQEVRIGESEERPIIFDSRLRALRDGMQSAVDAAVRNAGDGVLEAFEKSVTADLCDDEGMTIG